MHDDGHTYDGRRRSPDATPFPAVKAAKMFRFRSQRSCGLRRLVGSLLVVATFVMLLVSIDRSPADAAPGCGTGALDAAQLNSLFANAGLGATPAGEGFGGGDYPHAYPLPDGRILWMFQDTFFSNDNVLGSTNAVHNGALVQQGNCWTMQGSRGRDFIGDAQTLDSRRFFWPLDAEIGADGNLWVFMAQMDNPNGNGAALGVRPIRTWRAVLDPVSLQQLAFDPAPNSSAQLYGQSIVSTDQWTYLYGNCYKQFVGAPTGPSEFDSCMRNTYVARVPLRQLGAVPTYWNGAGWVDDPGAAVPVTSRGQNAAMMNVQWFGDTFVNVTKLDEWWGTEIVIDRASSATGPWTTVDTINILSDRKCNRCGIYGAFLMPWLDNNGDMTIAVANGTDFNTWQRNAFLYRPTFYSRAVPTAETPLGAATAPTFDVGNDRSGFIAVDPERLIDTREPDQSFGRMNGNELYELDLTDRAPPNATAVALNLAASRTDDRGFIRAFPCNETEPTTSTLNPLAGQSVSNAAIVPLGDRRLCFRSQFDVDLIVDLNGWMSTDGTLGLEPIVPRRLFDSRTGDGGGRLVANQVVEVDAVVAGSDAEAVALSVTAIKPAGFGFVTAWPCGTPRPLAANLNTAPQITRPNYANVRVGGGADNGKVCLYTSGDTDLVVDVLGEYRPSAPARYTPVGPTRILDTRPGADGHRYHSSNLAELLPLGDVVAGQMNLTAVRPSGAGFTTGYACLTQPWPGTANVNYAAGDTATTLALVGSDAGYGCVYNSVPTNVVADLYGVWRE